MKHIILTTLIFLLCTLAGGCGIVSDFSTEVYYSLDNPVPVRVDEIIDTLCSVKYTMDGKQKQIIIQDQRNLDYFLYVMLREAEKGADISMQTDQRIQSMDKMAFASGKEPVTFTTTDNNRAKEWVKKMLLKGYRVDIVYNRKDKTYTCTAYPKS